ncbi:helix-turn-helix domain-containing protein [Caballeronia sp. INDeC2]|uniref:helix-turn-helix domain-containing protein n=1 Tax=Caballeronia sp. INDeC2 TaxID=2921747 RepID=UPI002027BD8A|nr:helix-turn-helix domain-containing protein [Caballeronia sp. INDeC2]
MSDDIDPALVAVLAQLWRARTETPGRAWSLARIAKQAGLPMSALRRQLTGLTDGGLVDMQMTEEGTGSAWLTEQGAALCQEVFGNSET